MGNLKNDVDSLVGNAKLTADQDRRTFIQTTVGVGFAAAVLPVCAQTMIKTDTVGLSAGAIEIPVKNKDGTVFSMPMYHAQPEGKKNPPVVIVVSEVFGLHEHIADLARRFAKLGYLAVAPDLFKRQGDPAKYPTISELIDKVVSKVPDDQVMGDIDACVAWAKANGGNIEKLGITGFCWGGRITWLYAAHNPHVKAGAAWYGRFVGDKSELNPRNPIDIAETLTVPVLGLYGEKDTGIPQDTVQQMRAALAKGHSKSEIVVYPNSGHAFNADYRPSYVKADAEDGWKRTLEWFKAHGVS